MTENSMTENYMKWKAKYKIYAIRSSMIEENRLDGNVLKF